MSALCLHPFHAFFPCHLSLPVATAQVLHVPHRQLACHCSHFLLRLQGYPRNQEIALSGNQGAPGNLQKQENSGQGADEHVKKWEGIYIALILCNNKKDKDSNFFLKKEFI